MKILAMTPNYGGMVWADSADSVANNLMDLVADGHEVRKLSLHGYGCGPARTRIADIAVDGGYDFLFMNDDDVVLPDGALRRMVGHDVDVCLGYYAHQNSFDGKTCLCEHGKTYHDQLYDRDIEKMRDAGETLFRVRGGGMGCALIKVGVFERMAYPYFRWVDYEGRIGTLSEDLYFCEQCKKLGIPVYADALSGCEHHFRYKQKVM